MIVFGSPTKNADLIAGDDGHDWIYGDDGNDLLLGAGGNDILLGNHGDDTLIPGYGIDFIYGGFLDGDSGNDTVSYGNYTSGVEVSLKYGYGFQKSLGDADKDTLRGMENIAGSNYEDRLVGDAGANKIYGNGGNDLLGGMEGNDSLYGGNGDDEISGGLGADVIDGGAGNDTATYFTSSAGVVINLAAGFGLFGQAQGDTLAGIENLQGSFYNDTFLGSAVANALYGQEGDDQLYGYEGDDLVHGGEGNDTLNGGANNDRLIGDWGKDTMTGGTGADWFIFNETGGTFYDTSANLAQADVITDFSHAQGDRIDLSSIGTTGHPLGDNTDHITFTFRGESFFTGTPGELRYMRGFNETYVMADTDGDFITDFQIVLTGSQTLTAGDFVL